MKITALILFIACLQVSARGYAQTVSISVSNASIEKVFQEIKKQTGYNFFYEAKILEDAKEVTITVKNASLDEVLNLCFKNQPLTYTIIEKTIVVKKKENSDKSPNVETTIPNDVPLPIDITGTVTTTKGEPLSGAYVINKKTGKGTTTDAKGYFVLSNLNVGDVIVVSFLGYKDLSIKVGNVTNLALVMVETSNELDKVQIQAYGTTSKRLSTGNITTITAEQIEKQPNMNVLATLQGQVPGMVISQSGNGAYASAPFKVEIRGRSVINPNLPSEPLYIVDGVPLNVLELGSSSYASGSIGITQNGFTGPAGGQSPLFSINPADIESISVLKDADATSIYGSRGANGVVIITTKKGQIGKTKLEGNFYQGISEITEHYSLMNTLQYVAMRKEAFKNDGLAMTNGNAFDLLMWDTTRYTDWQKFTLGGTGKIAYGQLSLTGGDMQTNFRISATYQRQTDVLTVSGSDQRASTLFSFNHKNHSDKLFISFSGIYTNIKSNLFTMPNAVLLPPNAPDVFDANGHLNWSQWGSANSPATVFLNQFSGLFQPYTAKTDLLNNSLKIRYQITKGFDFSINSGISKTFNQQTQTVPILSQDIRINPTGTTGLSRFGNNNSVNLIIGPSLEYKGFIGKGKLTLNSGGTYQSQTFNSFLITGTGYTNDNLLGSIGAATGMFSSNGSGQYKYAGIYARCNYNISDKYIINLSGRRDGSSKFGPNKQFSNFGSVGVSWIEFRANYRKNQLSYNDPNNPPNDNEKEIWRTWMITVFIPINEKIYKIVTENADLIIENNFPQVLKDLCAHVETYRPVILKWNKGDFSEHTSLINYPLDLDKYAQKSFDSLKSLQQKLLK